jgi:hypothetical protein
MDASKKYIQLCEKAQEIQDLWQYDDGDFYLHRFTDENTDDKCKVLIGKDINMTLCIVCNVKDSYGDQYVSEYNPKGENVWLPRQDQLQSIYAENTQLDTEGLLEVITDFRDFCDPFDRLGTMPLPVATREAEEEEKYVKQFTSMEQLWLAVVMKENFQKIWNGEEWENDNL